MAIGVSIHMRKNKFCLDVDFQTKSKRIGVLGASGCGKSMTLKTIAGIETPQNGQIQVDETCFLDTEKRINVSPQKRQTGYLFQNYALFPTMSVEKNIRIGIRDKTKEEQKQIFREMVKKFQLQGCEKKYPCELSGGQQQRVALARIMAYHPNLIMLDEPFSALDSFLKENLKHEMKEFLKNYEGTMILVSHSRDEIYELSDWLIIMEHGRIVEMGNTKGIFLRPSKRQTARLTGCKNISAIKKIGEHTCLALDWDIVFEVEMEISDKARYIGFRAHHLKITDEVQNVQNTFTAEIQSISDAPFEETYFLKTISSKEAHEKENQTMCFKIHKESMELRRREKELVYVSISPKDIFVMEE